MQPKLHPKGNAQVMISFNVHLPSNNSTENLVTLFIYPFTHVWR